MTWKTFKDRVETLRASHVNTDDTPATSSGDEKIRLEPVNDRESFVRRIKAVLAA